MTSRLELGVRRILALGVAFAAALLLAWALEALRAPAPTPSPSPAPGASRPRQRDRLYHRPTASPAAAPAAPSGGDGAQPGSRRSTISVDGKARGDAAASANP